MWGDNLSDEDNTLLSEIRILLESNMQNDYAMNELAKLAHISIEDAVKYRAVYKYYMTMFGVTHTSNDQESMNGILLEILRKSKLQYKKL